MDEYESRLIQMPWRDRKNVWDCGIYLMKHMESYHGQPVKQWNVGLKKNEVLNLLFRLS